MKYDLVVAYRIYPGISKVPPAFPNDKYALSKFCLDSFKKSLEGLKVKMHVIMDNCPIEYETMFRDSFDAADLEIIKLDGVGNKKTFKKQLEILSAQSDADIVYFAEDDYFYIENLKNMFDFVKSGQADFATPYEHPACYTDGHVICNSLKLFNNRRYVTVQHACMTFMTTKAKLIENKRIFLIYPDYFASDFVVWGCTTLGSAYFNYAKLLLHIRNFTVDTFKVYGSMWFFAWGRFLFNKKYTLYMPIQTIATHMESNFLSPGIEWEHYFKDKK
jgi:hypothetical protein